MPELRDGTHVEDGRLGRLVRFDERSRDYPLRAVVSNTTLRSKTWGVPGVKLDQGYEGACVGAGVTHELIAYPKSNLGLDMKFARERIYWAAQRRDPWDGGSYPGADPQYEGTSVIDGVKVARDLGYYASYHWAFTIDEICQAVAWDGPVIVGTNWLEGMDEPRPSGMLDVEGRVRGGHCYLITGLTLHPRLPGEASVPVFRIRNSWGPTWGRIGDAFITVEDFEQYLMPDGEAVQPRGRVKQTPPTGTGSAASRPSVARGLHSHGLVDWRSIRGWRVA